MNQHTTPPVTSTLAIALSLAERGFHVFPVVANGKLPAIGQWPARATRDPDAIRKMWTEHDPVLNVTRERAFNIGIATARFGDDRHLLVLDVDIKGNGPETLDGLKLQYDPEPFETMTVRTPSGGQHLYFVSDKPLACTVRKVGPGLDTRGDGGFVVGPGSTINGKPYELQDGPLLPVPYFLAEAVGPPVMRDRNAQVAGLVDDSDATVARARDYLVRVAAPAIQGEGGDTHTVAVACGVRDFGVSELVCLDLMFDHWNGRCEPPWDYEALGVKVSNAYQYGKKAAGSLAPDFGPLYDEHGRLTDEGRAHGLPENLIRLPREKAPDKPEAEKPKRKLVLTMAEFMAGFETPSYLLDGIIRRGAFYCVTANTGDGKTAVLQRISAGVALGRQVHGLDVEPGSVLWLAGENPDDIRMRWRALAHVEGFDLDSVPIHSIDGVIDIGGLLSNISKHVRRIGNVVMIVVDTAMAYFPGEDSNDNVAQKRFAAIMRALTKLENRPTVLVPTHPIKQAPRDKLVPLGGGAFINEADGNFTLWRQSKTARETEWHWHGKLRGPDFKPLTFSLDTVWPPGLVDHKDRPVPSVVARDVADTNKAGQTVIATEQEMAVLVALYREPTATQGRIAESAGISNKGTVSRSLANLAEAGLLERREKGAPYTFTPVGRTAAEQRIRASEAPKFELPSDVEEDQE